MGKEIKTHMATVLKISTAIQKVEAYFVFFKGAENQINWSLAFKYYTTNQYKKQVFLHYK